MILESTQILCTVLNSNGIKSPYRSSHLKHPCVIWAGKSLDNWLWLRKLTTALNKEYQFRFNHELPHKSFLVAKNLPIPSLPSLGITERPQAMPDKYKVPGNPIAAYRKFYACGKRHLIKYTKRSIPGWLTAINCNFDL